MTSPLRLPSAEALGLAVDARVFPVLRLDEIHHLPDWTARLKGQRDRLRRGHLPLNVVANGSAVRVASGSRQSLAGLRTNDT